VAVDNTQLPARKRKRLSVAALVADIGAILVVILTVVELFVVEERSFDTWRFVDIGAWCTIAACLFWVAREMRGGPRVREEVNPPGGAGAGGGALGLA